MCLVSYMIQTDCRYPLSFTHIPNSTKSISPPLSSELGTCEKSRPDSGLCLRHFSGDSLQILLRCSLLTHKRYFEEVHDAGNSTQGHRPDPPPCKTLAVSLVNVHVHACGLFYTCMHTRAVPYTCACIRSLKHVHV